MTLLLLVAVAGYVLGAAGIGNWYAFVAVIVGGACASGGAAAFNMGIEGDIDRQMGRTKGRPVAQGTISRRNALIFGFALNLAAFIVLLLLANWLAAVMAIVGTVLYVLLYTLILKRSTVQNIVVGGAAGAVPPLVGYAAATGTLDFSALFFFGLIFFWTPPHFWALALMIKKDYAKVNIPMLPVVEGTRTTAVLILLYTVQMVAITIAYTVVDDALGYIYLACATVLGIFFILLAWRTWRAQGAALSARQLYKYSLLYMFLLSTAIIVDAVVTL